MQKDSDGSIKVSMKIYELTILYLVNFMEIHLVNFTNYLQCRFYINQNGYITYIGGMYWYWRWYLVALIYKSVVILKLKLKLDKSNEKNMQY